MPLLPSALPPKGEASRYDANNFLNLIALLPWGRLKDGSFATIFMDGQRETREGANPSNQGEANPVSLRSSASSKGRGENMRSTHKKRRAAPHLPR